MEKLEIDPKIWDPRPPKILGRRDDEWVMIEFGDIMVNCMVEAHREEMNLEEKWKNPLSDSEVEKWERIAKFRKQKELFEPLVD